MDESGKFQDHEVVALGAVTALDRNHSADFANEWAFHLRRHGMEYLSMKEALNLRSPLGNITEARTLDERIAALLPFVMAARRHLHMISGVAIDVEEYKSLPQQYRQIWSDNPCYTGFARVVLQLVNESPVDGLIMLYCDDEEQTALPTYQLYRKIKNQYADARGKLKGISFLDDEYCFPLQAADMVAVLIRHEALFRFRNQPNHFHSLYEAMTKSPVPGEIIFSCGVAWCDKEQLSGLGEKYKSAKLDKNIVQLTDLSEDV
jgi:hypothetical protein